MQVKQIFILNAFTCDSIVAITARHGGYQYELYSRATHTHIHKKHKNLKDAFVRTFTQHDDKVYFSALLHENNSFYVNGLEANKYLKKFYLKRK